VLRLGPVPYGDEWVEDLAERRDELRAELAAIDARLRRHRRTVVRERLASARSDLVGLFTVAGILFVVSGLGWWLEAHSFRCGGGIQQARTDAQSPGAVCPTVEILVRERMLSSRMTSLDPWDKAFVISCDGETVRVLSRGPDRMLGTADDVE
jgi:hypothetical protein